MIVSTTAGRQITLFFSGRKHAGENLREVLAERAAELEAPIQMCDALSRNMPQELKTILADCLAHARRHFVDLVEAHVHTGFIRGVNSTHITPKMREAFRARVFAGILNTTRASRGTGADRLPVAADIV